MARCRDCKLYDIDAVRNARGAVLSNRVGRCLWTSTEVYPASVRDGHMRPMPSYMTPNGGDRCQRFIKREA